MATTKKPDANRVVMCMRWGPLFPATYVNVLYSAVKKNLEKPFRFVCLTDNPEGLADGIEHFPIPDIGLPGERYYSGVWPKLAVYKKDLYGLTGRCLYLDLDTVIVRSLEPLFELKGDFFGFGEFNNVPRGEKSPTPTLNTSVFSFDLGGQAQILDKFLADPQAAYDRFANEQECAEAFATSWKPWPEPMVVSFKRHLRQPVLLDMFLPPREPHKDTRIVAFHGDPRPIDVIGRTNKPWGKFPHYGRKPIGWVRDYWIDNGFDMTAK